MMTGINLARSSAGNNTKASVIDLGSNSVKMANYNVGSYKPYHQESARVKLAEGLVDGVISDDHMKKTLETLRFFRSIVDFEAIDHVVAIATSAVRDAGNKSMFMGDIFNETGFDFTILSEREEALYSYAGAMCSLDVPNVVFFDIGGGSLEIVASQNYNIQKILSLPLGALRLTRQFSTDSGLLGNLSHMHSHVCGLLPSMESLGMNSKNAALVGVGGTLRAIARYEQDMIDYPLAKLHNYAISYKSLKSISKTFLSKTTQEISEIESMGNGRSYAIQAGSLVICELVKKLGFQSLTVGAQGLREGTLALSLRHPKEFDARRITAKHVQDMILSSCNVNLASESVENMTRQLFLMNMMTRKEKSLLVHTLAQIDKLSSFRDVNSILYTVMDDDSVLSHREQMIIALSLIYSKKKRKAESLISKFKVILDPTDKKTIKKISSIVSLCDIFHKTGASIRSKSDEPSLLTLDVYASKKTFPEILVQQACSKMESSLGITVKSNILYHDLQTRSDSNTQKAL